MAVHMTLGLLFLGGGRSTLASTPEAVAALLIAFFPKFPTHTEDNRYHLQAFRHLYVLAVENRLVLPRDIDTGNLCYVFIQVIDIDDNLREYKAPCIIPELNQLKLVKIDDTRYWPIFFQRDRNWDQLKTFLEYTWCIDIKQRAGCLPYSQDPQGFTTLLGHTLTLDQTNIWSAKPDNIDLFTNDQQVRSFIRHYLAQDDAGGTNICGDCLILKKKKMGKGELLNRTCVCRRYSKEEQEFIQSLSVVTYECVVKDVLRALPIWTSFLKIIKQMRTEPSSFHMWQIKLLLSQVESLSRRTSDEMHVDDSENEPLISTEFTLAVKQKIAVVFDRWELKIVPFLRKYLGMPSSRSINSCHDDIKRILASFLVYHELRRNLLGDSGFDTSELGLVMCEKASLSGVAASKVLELVR